MKTFDSPQVCRGLFSCPPPKADTPFPPSPNLRASWSQGWSRTCLCPPKPDCPLPPWAGWESRGGWGEALGAARLPEFDSRGSVAARTCVGTRGRPGVGASSQPRVHRAPIPARTPDPPTVCVGVPGRSGRPKAGEAAHLQSKAGQRAGGSHRRRGFLGRLPPAPGLRSRRGPAPGVESQRSQGLLEPQVFSGERRRGRGGGGERGERGGGGGGGGGRNWETEV